jgi:DNA-binding NarL/FixJ family response regulator
MNINVLLSLENDIVEKGMASILRDAILGSCIHYHKSGDVANRIESQFFDVLIISLKNKTDQDIVFLTNLLEVSSKTKIYIFSTKPLESKLLKFIKSNSLEIISISHSHKEIVKKIAFNLQNIKIKNTFKAKKSCKLKSLDILLSERELETALMLINGETITSISEKKSLATTTISTYRKRVFEKTKASNLIELAKIFKKSNYNTL